MMVSTLGSHIITMNTSVPDASLLEFDGHAAGTVPTQRPNQHTLETHRRHAVVNGQILTLEDLAARAGVSLERKDDDDDDSDTTSRRARRRERKHKKRHKHERKRRHGRRVVMVQENEGEGCVNVQVSSGDADLLQVNRGDGCIMVQNSGTLEMGE